MLSKAVLTLLLPAAALAAAGGCGVTTPARDTVPAVDPLRQAPAAVQARRAAEFRRLTAPLAVRGVALFPASYAGRVEWPELFNRIENLGFNRVYLHLSSESELNEQLASFLAGAGERGLPVSAVISVQDFYSRHRGNGVIRQLRPRYFTLREMAAKIAEFNAGLPPGSRFSGVVAVAEPHVFNDTRAVLPLGMLYCWSDSTYGPGLDNDLMLKAVVAALKELPERLGGLPLTVAVPDFYHEKAVAGELSVGRIGDFVELSTSGRDVIVCSGGNKPSELSRVVADELEAVRQDDRVLIEINLADHTSVASGALRRRDWNDLLRSLQYLISRQSDRPAFQGVVVGPLAAVEFMRLELD